MLLHAVHRLPQQPNPMQNRPKILIFKFEPSFMHHLYKLNVKTVYFVVILGYNQDNNTIQINLSQMTSSY